MSIHKKTFDLFVSYNSGDHRQIEAIAQQLRERGLTIFLDRWYLSPGLRWRPQLEDTLASCRAVVVCVGPDGLGTWQRREVDLALDRQSQDAHFPVIPLLLPGSEPPLGFLQQLTWVDLRNQPLEQGLLIIAEAVCDEGPSSELQHQMTATRAAICPYRGLYYFREEDAPFFFGRDATIGQLVKVVQHENFLAVVGASGSGKSSIVRAGLAPKLRRDCDTVWEIATLLPGGHPLRSLATALIPFLEPGMTESDRLAEVTKLSDYFFVGTVTLGDTIRRILAKQPGTNRMLLVADQWEELYTLTSDDTLRRRFVDELLDATLHAPLTVVLTLRGEFVGKALAYRPLSDRLQGTQINLGPMTRQELKQAVIQPAKQTGLDFEPGLASRILGDAGDEPGNLPLLEFVLKELWESRQGHLMLNRAYDDMDKLTGAIAKRAEEFFGSLSPPEKEATRRLFLQLIHAGPDGNDTRRRERLANIPQASRQLAERLADERLLVTAKVAEGCEETAEVAHEALIHNWKRLKRWLDEDREFLLWRQRLRAHLDEWESSRHGQEALLRGALLTEATKWLDKRSGDLGDSESRFIADSGALQEREAFMRDRRRRLVVLSLAGGLLGALLLAGAVRLQWKEADRLRRIAVVQSARLLAGEAQRITNQLPSLHQRGVLLAVESMLRSPSLEGDQALRNGMRLLAKPVAAMKHDGTVRRAAFSPTGEYVATVSEPNLVSVWDVTGTLKWHRTDHSDLILCMGFRPDGRYFATGSRDTTACVWQTIGGADQKPVRLKHQGPVSCISFSPDGRHVVTSSESTVRVWDPDRGIEISRLVHNSTVEDVVFSPNEAQLVIATASVNGSVCLWNMNDNNPKKYMEQKHKGAVNSVAFSRDGGYLASAGDDLTAHVWDVTTGNEVSSIAHDGTVYLIAFSPVEDHLATVSVPDLVQVWAWNADGAREVIRTKHEAAVRCLAFSSDGRYLATACRNTAQVWDANDGAELARINHEDSILSLAFSPDGNSIVTASRDGTARIWEATAGDEVACVDHNDTVNSVAFSPDGRFVVTAGEDGTLRQLSTDGGELITYLKTEHPVFLVECGPDGRSFAMASGDGTVRHWNVAHGSWSEPLLEGHLTRDIRFIADGRQLATTIDDTTVLVWNVAGGGKKKLAVLPHQDFVDDAVLSPDGRYVATGCDDTHVYLWDMTDKEPKESVRLMSCDGEVNRVAFSLNGRYLAAVSSGTVVSVWDVPKCQDRIDMERENDASAVSCIALSPKGEYLAMGSLNGTVSLWHAKTGHEVARMRHAGAVCSVGFSRDGKYLATSGRDRTARVWLWRPKELIEQAGSRLTRNLTYQEWQRYLLDETYRKTFPSLPDPRDMTEDP